VGRIKDNSKMPVEEKIQENATSLIFVENLLKRRNC